MKNRATIAILAAARLVLTAETPLFSLDWIDEHEQSATINEDELGIVVQTDMENLRSSLPKAAEVPAPSSLSVKVLQTINHAQNLAKENKPLEAEAAFTRAIAQDSKSLDAYRERAKFYVERREFAKADADFVAAAALAPLEHKAAFCAETAAAFASAGRYVEALPWYSRRVAAADQEWLAYAERAACLTRLNYYKPAIVDYDQALQLIAEENLKEKESLHYQRARLYEALGQKSDALADFLYAPSYKRELAEFYVRQGDKEDALRIYEEINRGFSAASAGAYANRADYYWLAGDIESAEADYQQALALSKNAALYARRARFYMELGRLEAAEEDLSEAINLNLDAAYRYADRARLYIRMGMNEEAVRDFSQAVDLEPARAFRYNERAKAYAALNRNSEAIADYAKALTLDPSNKTALAGWAELQKAQIAQDNADS